MSLHAARALAGTHEGYRDELGAVVERLRAAEERLRESRCPECERRARRSRTARWWAVFALATVVATLAFLGLIIVACAVAWDGSWSGIGR
jgi:type VI protein secretion system component VasF